MLFSSKTDYFIAYKCNTTIFLCLDIDCFQSKILWRDNVFCSPVIFPFYIQISINGNHYFLCHELTSLKSISYLHFIQICPIILSHSYIRFIKCSKSLTFFLKSIPARILEESYSNIHCVVCFVSKSLQIKSYNGST